MLQHTRAVLCGVSVLWLAANVARGDLKEKLTPPAQSHRGQSTDTGIERRAG